MATMNEKTTSLIVKLNQGTASGQIEWVARDAPIQLLESADGVIPYYYRTDWRGESFALYQRRFKRQPTPLYMAGARIAEMLAPPRTWQSVLLLLDEDERIQFEFLGHSALDDLLETVRRKTSKVEERLDQLLLVDEPDISEELKRLQPQFLAAADALADATPNRTVNVEALAARMLQIPGTTIPDQVKAKVIANLLLRDSPEWQNVGKGLYRSIKDRSLTRDE